MRTTLRGRPNLDLDLAQILRAVRQHGQVMAPLALIAPLPAKFPPGLLRTSTITGSSPVSMMWCLTPILRDQYHLAAETLQCCLLVVDIQAGVEAVNLVLNSVGSDSQTAMSALLSPSAI